MLSDVVTTFSTDFQGHAYGAPGRPALAGLVQWAQEHREDALNDPGVPRRRRPGAGESRRSWRAAWPAASSATAQRRGPLPAPPLPRTRHQPDHPP